MGINIHIEKKDLWLLSAIVVFLVGAGYVIAYRSGASPSVMGHSAEELEGVQAKIVNGLTTCAGANQAIKKIDPDTGVVTCETDDVGAGGSGTVPYYRVKYNPNSLSIYTIGGFSTAPYTYKLPSFGSVSGDDHTVPEGSYLFEMKVNVVTPVTKTLKLLWTDNNIQFFLDGTKVAPPTGETWNVVDYRTDTTKKADFVLSSGQHTIQIIFNAEGSFDYFSVIGDIVDNTNVEFVGF